MKELLQKLKKKELIIEVRLKNIDKKYYHGKINEIEDTYFSIVNEQYPDVELYFFYDSVPMIKVFKNYKGDIRKENE